MARRQAAKEAALQPPTPPNQKKTTPKCFSTREILQALAYLAAATFLALGLAWALPRLLHGPAPTQTTV